MRKRLFGEGLRSQDRVSVTALEGTLGEEVWISSLESKVEKNFYGASTLPYGIFDTWHKLKHLIVGGAYFSPVFKVRIWIWVCRNIQCPPIQKRFSISSERLLKETS